MFFCFVFLYFTEWGALHTIGEEYETQIFNIYNINEVIKPTQKYLFISLTE